MTSPVVSVIIPAYNGTPYLAQAIQSVLDQTFSDFELIVVDDVSTDNTPDVVRAFADPRVRYVLHAKNQGAIAARKTGVGLAAGEVFAFLDQDDTFHPQKLERHVAFLREHPEVGVTYNSRFELAAGGDTIRAIWEPPAEVTLVDLVLGFPFAPSDTVIRRELALRDDIWDQSFVTQGKERIFNGGEIVFGGRLFLTGCRLCNVGHTLTYRRYHPRRRYSDLELRCQAERDCQELILNDVRCPQEVRDLRDQALATTDLVWAYYAFAQGDTELGQRLVREVLRRRPQAAHGTPCEIARFIADHCAWESTSDLAELATSIFMQMPPDAAIVSSQRDWAIAESYLIRGTQAALWGRSDEAKRDLELAARHGATADEQFVRVLAHQLMSCQREFGAKATDDAMGVFVPFLESLHPPDSAKLLKGIYSVNRAFQSYAEEEYQQVPREVLRAIVNQPRFLLNRGVLSILVRSLAGRRFGLARG